MIRNRLSTACLAATMTLIAPASFGNDLVDFLRAVQSSGSHHGHHGHHAVVHHSGHHGSHGHRSHGYRPYHRSVSIHVGHTAPAPVSHPRHTILAPLPQAPHPSSIGALPHELGGIVTCPVRLESHVRIRNADEIAPHARPVIVAVRDPHLAAWGSRSCVEQLAYVQVLAPPVPLKEMSVSACRTEIVLDYGDWEIKILSRNGFIEVEYDD